MNTTRRALVITAPSPSDGVRIPRPSWGRPGSRAVRIWAPPPPPEPPRRRKGRTPSAPPARADAAAGAASAAGGGAAPQPAVAHTVRLATQADLPAMAAIERACGNPAWGPAELQHELDSPTATVAVVEAWNLRRARGDDDDPDVGRDEPAEEEASTPASTASPSSFPAVVGLAIWWTIADEVQLLELAVHPGARRRGAGVALASVVAALPPPGGCAVLEVAAGNAAARATYSAAGFKEVGLRRAYYKDGSDAVLMRRDVPKGSPPPGGGGGGRGELPVV